LTFLGFEFGDGVGHDVVTSIILTPGRTRES